MKILVTGVKGQLGYDVMKEGARRGLECIGADIDEFDITDEKQTHDFILSLRPDAVIHCAAYSAVDRAEDEPELCERVNAKGTENIAKAAKEIDAKMIYISTDYVFDGKGDTPFETDSPAAPQCEYGKSKYMGELAVKELLSKYFIVRISWVFGVNGNNFVKTMLRLAKTNSEIRVVNDQIGSPTCTADLAPLLLDMVVTDKYGVYHATNEGICSWYEFASKIFEYAGVDVKVTGIPTSEYKAAKAVRPMNSRMSKRSLSDAGFKLLPRWEDTLKWYVEQVKETI